MTEKITPQIDTERDSKKNSRRKFLGTVGTAGVATIVAGSLGTTATAKPSFDDNNNESFDTETRIKPDDRVDVRKRESTAFKVRQDAAKTARDLRFVNPVDNGDEARYPNKIGSFTKSLPHNSLGLVDLNAYRALTDAIASGTDTAFDAVPLGGNLKLVNPVAGIAFELVGPDPAKVMLPPAPRFDSAEEAGEMVELYWMALTRDVPFSRYDSDPMIAAAATELSGLRDFFGPKQGGAVTPSTIFRGKAPGETIGPYISQLLYKPFIYGAIPIDQRFRVPLPNTDHMFTYADWLSVQNGIVPTTEQIDPVRRFIYSGRAMSEVIHNDPLYQLPYNAAQTLLGLRIPLSSTNPYRRPRSTQGFNTFGGPFIFSLVAAACNKSLTAVWFNKWYVHRRLRPEEFGGHVHNMMIGAANYPIHPQVLNSEALSRIFSKFGTYLLPQVFPEGSPVHPAYGAGHAAFGYAGVTILKALFDETAIIPNPVMPNDDGTALVPYVGPPLTVGGELNKLGSNIAIVRNTAGVHWRTDADSRIGEIVAIEILREIKESGALAEDFPGFSFTKFDGTRITI